MVPALSPSRSRIREMYRKATRMLYDSYFSYRHQPDQNVMDEDWDNLIILDSCRFDLFKSKNTIGGDLGSRMRFATHSRHFLENHFAGERFQDTVYVTGNANVSLLEDGIFHAIVPVEIDKIENKERYRTTEPGSALPAESNAVWPEDVVEKAIDAYERFPEKRLIVHFMQPHEPFIGPKGLELYRRYMEANDELAEKGSYSREKHGEIFGVNWYNLFRDNESDITEDEALAAYEENFELVLESVEELLSAVPGKTVLTADHGEMLGERLLPVTPKLYGHGGRAKTLPLCKVPWHVVEGTERRSITAEPPVESERMDMETVEKQLTALGYK